MNDGTKALELAVEESTRLRDALDTARRDCATAQEHERDTAECLEAALGEQTELRARVAALEAGLRELIGAAQEQVLSPARTHSREESLCPVPVCQAIRAARALLAGDRA